MIFTRITTAGAGTMGSQVAWQMAFHGKHVTVYDAIPAGLEQGRAFHRRNHSAPSSSATPMSDRSGAESLRTSLSSKVSTCQNC